MICGTAHYWARTLEKMGHRVRLIQPQRVKTFLGYRNKTDAADAKAICEALMHPGTRFVRIKSIEQQDTDSQSDTLLSGGTGYHSPQGHSPV
jgi:transposase